MKIYVIDQESTFYTQIERYLDRCFTGFSFDHKKSLGALQEDAMLTEEDVLIIGPSISATEIENVADYLKRIKLDTPILRYSNDHEERLVVNQHATQTFPLPVKQLTLENIILSLYEQDSMLYDRIQGASAAFTNLAETMLPNLPFTVLPFLELGAAIPRMEAPYCYSITISSTVGDYELCIASTEEGCQFLGKLMLGLNYTDDNLGTEDLNDALKETVNVIAGDMQHELGDYGIGAKLSIPTRLEVDAAQALSEKRSLTKFSKIFDKDFLLIISVVT